MKKISVIIITKNQKKLLQRTIPTLLNQKIRNSYEIIVVDSGSTDGAREYIQNLPALLIAIDSETFNFSNAFNTGAKKATGEYLIRLSGDAIPVDENFLSEMIKPFNDPRVGGVYGKYTIARRKGYGYPDYWPAERFSSRLVRYHVNPGPFWGVNLFGLEFGDDKLREQVFNFAGGCCAIRKSIWGKRPLNEKLIAGEDAEYSWFLHLIGYDIVYNPKAEVIHEHKLKKDLTSAFRVSKRIFYWQWIFNWEISRYWLKRFLGLDPYKDLRIS